MKTVLVTGGAGFIGSALVRYLIEIGNYKVCSFDKLTYAGNLDSLSSVDHNERYSFVRGDVCNPDDLKKLFKTLRPELVFHLAAESHVDRSIDGPIEFINTNVVGTARLLEISLNYWRELDSSSQENFRVVHVSTDEVFGSLGEDGLFNESSLYDPSSPYSASKASSDHLVRAWNRTYGLPTIISNCSNNYGPYQFPEKLIPLVICRAVEGLTIPVYGTGNQVRDWLYVDDHARALHLIAESGVIGETYLIGGNNEQKNLDVVERICQELNEKTAIGPTNIANFKDLIRFVTDRPGHDARYAIDSTKLVTELKWTPKESFESGITKTVDWYLSNSEWVGRIKDGSYRTKRPGLQGTVLE